MAEACHCQSASLHTRLRRAVLVDDLELRQQGRPAAIRLPRAAQSEESAVPAVGEQGVDRVRTLRDVLGHVVHLVADALAVVGPARRELLVTDAASPDRDLVEPESGHVEAGARHQPLDVELASQRGHRRGGGRRASQRCGDPGCRPVFSLEKAHLEARRLAPGRRRPVAVEAAHLPPRALARCERLARVRNLRVRGGVDAARVPEVGALRVEASRVRRHEHLTRALDRAGALVPEPPGEARTDRADPDGVDLVLAAQGMRTHASSRCGRESSVYRVTRLRDPEPVPSEGPCGEREGTSTSDPSVPSGSSPPIARLREVRQRAASVPQEATDQDVHDRRNRRSPCGPTDRRGRRGSGRLFYFGPVSNPRVSGGRRLAGGLKEFAGEGERSPRSRRSPGPGAALPGRGGSRRPQSGSRRRSAP